METNLEFSIKFIKAQTESSSSVPATGDFTLWFIIGIVLLLTMAMLIAIYKKNKVVSSSFAVFTVLAICCLPVVFAHAKPVTDNVINMIVQEDGSINTASSYIQNDDNGYNKIKAVHVIELNPTNNADWTFDFKDSSYTTKANGEFVDMDVALSDNEKKDFDIMSTINADTALQLIDKDVVKVQFTLLKYADPREKYCGDYTDLNGSITGMSVLGDTVSSDGLLNENTLTKNKQVGIFYFLWSGQHGTDGPYDNNKISQNKQALTSEDNWMKYGGGERGAHSFWGEPLYGYYTENDEWVFRKHCQMLTDAGIDYLIFDATNSYIYSDQFKKMLSVWYEYLESGYKVPKFAFYTNSKSLSTMTALYKELYNNEELYAVYPNLDKLWFKIDAKPMIIGKNSDELAHSCFVNGNNVYVSTLLDAEGKELIDDKIGDPMTFDELQKYFTIKLSQWPNEDKKANNSWPWMEFGRYMTDDQIYYDQNGNKMVTNISVAQHNETVQFSSTAWYGQNDRTRSFHNGYNDPAPDAFTKGYNFSQQWEWILKHHSDLPYVFLTGWNEWVAQRQVPDHDQWPVRFVDCADPNNSRDIEPMVGGYNDNYYMLLLKYMEKYKANHKRVSVGQYHTIDINASFDQWDDARITANYSDYVGDTKARDALGFGDIHYTNKTGRYDFEKFKVCYDKDAVYFYCQCAEAIKGESASHKNVLFLVTDKNDANWNGYNYAVNLEGDGVLSKCVGGWNWQSVSQISYKIEDNKMMLKVPFSRIGLDKYNDGLIDINFKWADNFQGEGDAMSFYKDGDVAPFGRMNFVYSNVL